MTLKQIYNIIIEEGIRRDPRGKSRILLQLNKKRREYKRLSPKEKRYFDLDSLFNPYADTRIIYGDGNREIKRVLVGIDINVGEILLADSLTSKGKKIDLCISHHPEGKAWANFYEVMDLQSDIFSSFGIATNVATGLLKERKLEVARKVHAANHTQTADAARLLDIPLLCMHTVSDNQVTFYLNNLIKKNNPQKVSQIIDILEDIPEYQIAKRNNAGPQLILGSKNNKPGKIIVEMTGGTEGPKRIIDYYTNVGIGTIVCMHLSEEHFKVAKDKNLNIIVAGHIASDNIGMNLLLDVINKKADIEVVCCSGFTRIKRD